jgi:hypothetical protein
MKFEFKFDLSNALKLDNASQSKKFESRASVAALRTMLWTTMHLQGNMRLSGTCSAEAHQPKNMKFCTID